MIKKFIARELQYLDKLNKKSKAVLFSFIAYSVASPLLGIFSNAYIWNKTNDFVSVAIYNLGNAIGLSIMFYINGFLLRKINIGVLYAIGLLFSGTSTFLLIFVKDINNPIIFSLGLLFGLIGGVYWANRNLLTLGETSDEERNYFSSLEISSDTIISVFVPIIFGFIIEAGRRISLVGEQDTYRLLIILAIIVLVIGAIYIFRNSFDSIKPKTIMSLRSTPMWNRMRLLTAIQGVSDGIFVFFSTAVVLYLVGTEGVLGLIQSVSYIITSTVLYMIGKYSKQEHRVSIIKYGVILLSLATIIYIGLFGIAGTLIYVVLNTLGVYLVWNGFNPLVMQAIDKDLENRSERTYFYIADREVFQNLGRCIGIGTFILLASNLQIEATLKVTAGIVFLANILLYLLSKLKVD